MVQFQMKMPSASVQLQLALVCAVALVVLAPAPAHSLPQYRPSYAPRPGGFSQVLPQYLSGGEAELGDRNSVNEPLAPGASNSLDDTQLTNRVQEWPRPNQPFWYINRQHIAQHTGQSVPCNGFNCPPIAPAPQSSFIG